MCLFKATSRWHFNVWRKPKRSLSKKSAINRVHSAHASQTYSIFDCNWNLKFQNGNMACEIHVIYLLLLLNVIDIVLQTILHSISFIYRIVLFIYVRREKVRRKVAAATDAACCCCLVHILASVSNVFVYILSLTYIRGVCATLNI